MEKKMRDKPKDAPEAPKEDLIDWAKGRARAVLEKGDLKGAVDTMVADLTKNPDMQAQMPMIAMMAMSLKADPEFDEKKVSDFIEGF